MQVKVFSLYDSKAKTFGPPFFYQERGQAIRELKDVVETGQGMIGKHPDDFVMYQIAEYSDQIGEFINTNPHELISMASDFKPSKPIIPNQIISTENSELKAVS